MYGNRAARSTTVSRLDSTLTEPVVAPADDRTARSPSAGEVGTTRDLDDALAATDADRTCIAAAAGATAGAAVGCRPRRDTAQHRR